MGGYGILVNEVLVVGWLADFAGCYGWLDPLLVTSGLSDGLGREKGREKGLLPLKTLLLTE